TSTLDEEEMEPGARVRIGDVNEWLTKFVDPLIGTRGGGNVFPGPCLPFGVVKVGFDTNQLEENNSGSNGKITGISLELKISSLIIGVPQYGIISQFPMTISSLEDINLNDYGSSRTFEIFKVGYSKFGLESYDTVVELTATRRTGFHRYTFPKGKKDNARVILDLSNVINGVDGNWMKYNGGIITSVSTTQIKGFGRYSSAWSSSPEYDVYFCSQFKTPAKSFATFWSNEIYPDSTYQVGVNSIGAILTFDTSKENVILSRVGISFISAEVACRNAEMEVGEDWDFEKIREKAEASWEVELEKVEIHGGTKEMKKIFYSGLYRSMQKRVVDIARSLIDTYHNEGFMPDGRSGMYNSISRGGSNGDMVLSELFLKKLGKGKINWELGYKAMLKNAFAEPWFRGSNEGRLLVRFYKIYGYIPLITPPEYEIRYREQGVCSKTMEYASVKGFISPINLNGERVESLDNFFKTSKYIAFYDGSSWEYSLNVPHGGPKEFEKRLDLTFSSKSYDNDYFNIKNVPSLFHPNLYHYIGKQYKSIHVIRDIMKKKFGSGRDGLPAKNLTERNIYIQSAKLNNRVLRNTWFRHSEIAKGGILELEMGGEVSKNWGVLEDENERKAGFGEWFSNVKTSPPPSLSDI
ncbi:2584_t:CDS:10, partial [Acaulospora colombiana]